MDEDRLFLRNRFNYYLTIAVIITTLLSWFNLNSYLIILLLVCRLMDGGVLVTLRRAARARCFRAYSALFLLELAGLLYTHDLYAGWKVMESKATLLAIPFILCAGPFTDREGYRKLMKAYCLILAGICAYCLSAAAWAYHWMHDPGVFFYLQLSGAVGVNAVFFSGYVLVAVLFLLFPGLPASPPHTARRLGVAPLTRLRLILLFFFMGMLILLSSRLMLLLAIGAIPVCLVRLRRPGMRRTPVYSLGVLVLVLLGTLAATTNPFSNRYRELKPQQVSASVRQEAMDRSDINGISLRLFMWRSAIAILDEGHAWFMGVSGGDSQIRLNQKYMAAGMSQGYLGYNFHDQYVEELVHSGVPGGIVFLLFIAALVGLARTNGTAEAAFTAGMVILLCATESALEMQHGLFLCSFFPLLTQYSRQELFTGRLQPSPGPSPRSPVYPDS